MIATPVSRTLVRIGALLLVLLFAALASAQEIPRFDIRAFRVEGNTLLPRETVDALVKPFIGARYVLGKRVSLQADYARVVDAGANINRGAWKLHARIGITFWAGKPACGGFRGEGAKFAKVRLV